MSLNFMINLLTGKFNKKSKLSEEDNVNDMKKNSGHRRFNYLKRNFQVSRKTNMFQLS